VIDFDSFVSQEDGKYHTVTALIPFLNKTVKRRFLYFLSHTVLPKIGKNEIFALAKACFRFEQDVLAVSDITM
jgi:hypothetical protein